MTESLSPPAGPAGSDRQLACTPAIAAYQKQWFADLRRRVVEEGEPYVLATAMSPHEIFEVFDLPFLTNEWWSGLVAAKQQSARALAWLERHGYHRDLPHYSALALGSTLDRENPDPPWGGLPPPALLCGELGRGMHLWEAMARHFQAPLVGLSVPPLGHITPRWWEVTKYLWEDVYEAPRIDRIVADYHELIEACERLSGRRFDIDRLREVMERVNRQEEYFVEARQVICDAPRLPVSMTEQMRDVMTIQWHRGTEWALQTARTFRDEVAARAARGEAVCPGERLRLLWGGVGLWQNTDFYRAFEETHGAVFVRSMYLSIAADGYIRHGLQDPLRALASRYAGMVHELHTPPFETDWLVHEAMTHRIHGAVSLPGDIHRFRALALDGAGIRHLVLGVDAVDGRTWDDRRVREEMDRFLETLSGVRR